MNQRRKTRQRRDPTTKSFDLPMATKEPPISNFSQVANWTIERSFGQAAEKGVDGRKANIWILIARGIAIS